MLRFSLFGASCKVSSCSLPVPNFYDRCGSLQKSVHRFSICRFLIRRIVIKFILINLNWSELRFCWTASSLPPLTTRLVTSHCWQTALSIFLDCLSIQIFFYCKTFDHIPLDCCPYACPYGFSHSADCCLFIRVSRASRSHQTHRLSLAKVTNRPLWICLSTVIG